MSAITLKRIIGICWLLIGFITFLYLFVKDTRGVPYNKTSLHTDDNVWIEALLCIVCGGLSPLIFTEVDINESIKKLLYKLANIGVNNK